jgi:hypothetical protein
MPETNSVFIHARHGPPDNELPTALRMSGIVWQANGTAVAVPFGLVYTTGIVLTIMCRTREPRKGDIQEAGRRVRLGLAGQGDDPWPDFTCNGKHLVLLGGQHRDYGFTYTGWVPFTDATPARDLTLAFEWPAAGIVRSEYRVTGTDVAEASGNSVILWPAAPK